MLTGLFLVRDGNFLLFSLEVLVLLTSGRAIALPYARLHVLILQFCERFLVVSGISAATVPLLCARENLLLGSLDFLRRSIGEFGRSQHRLVLLQHSLRRPCV